MTKQDLLIYCLGNAKLPSFRNTCSGIHPCVNLKGIVSGNFIFEIILEIFEVILENRKQCLD